MRNRINNLCSYVLFCRGNRPSQLDVSKNNAQKDEKSTTLAELFGQNKTRLEKGRQKWATLGKMDVERLHDFDLPIFSSSVSKKI